VVGITGYGNVSQGAQQILELLEARQVSPEGLAGLQPKEGGVVKVVFEERHLVQPVEPRSKAFDLQDYYDNPAGYRSVFGSHLPLLHVLVNCIYWDERYPRLVTTEQLRQLWAGPHAPRLRVIGDISCDVEGSVEATLKATTPQDPVFLYDVDSGQAKDGVQGNGPLIMAVDNLPAELPREASRTFSGALLPFVPALASMDASRPLASCGLPPPLLRAVIAYNGQLTDAFADLQQYL
jgi:alpha-aminoadipic semialdehyde synthase